MAPVLLCPFKAEGLCNRTDCWHVSTGECKFQEEMTRVLTTDNTSSPPAASNLQEKK